MHVEDLFTGMLVRVPRRVKKHAKKNGVKVTGKAGKKTWLGIQVTSADREEVEG